jgi:hypothetical protein
MEEVVALPRLQDNVPVAVVDKTELPQLSTSVTVGAGGTVFGVAVAVPAELAQPLTVVVTE